MRPVRLISFVWSLSAGASIRVKIMGIVLVLVLLLGFGVTLQVRNALSRALGDELDKRAVSVARDLGARSADLILTNNTYALYELLRETVENNGDVRYAFILDPNGNVFVHTFGQRFPAGLGDSNTVLGGERHHLEVLDTEEGLIRDVAVPIFDRRAGVARVGLTERRVHGTVDATTRQLLAATGLVSLAGILAAYFLTAILTKPIIELAGVAQALGRGDLSKRASVWTKDEIGQLGTTFNEMAASLDRSRREGEKSSLQLLQRNRELTALNAVADAVSGPLSLQRLLEASLDTVLGLMGFEAGWIALRDGDSLTIEVERGVPTPNGKARKDDPTSCVCGRVLNGGQAQLVDARRDPCPRLSPNAPGGLICHASIPLKSKAQVLGVMNLAATRYRDLSQEELSLLGAIGGQIGVAIENSRLYEELQRKEELRGQLLVKVIAAQEEERKRIARELHDQTSQSLTSLMVGLRVLEGSSTLQEVQNRASDLRSLVTRTLAEVHDLALELRPSVLDDVGLAAAMQRHIGDYARKTELNVDFESVGFEDRRLPPEVETALYRVVQEALTNVARHANARNVSVLLEARDASVVAIVEDDGHGFDLHEVMGSPVEERRLGLFGMHERVTLFGGDLTIESRPGEGTSVIVQVPLEQS